jgi:glycosyltransferase involved in cell wall biosynthesis
MTLEYFNNKDLFLKTLIGVKSGIVDDSDYKELIFKAPGSIAYFFETSNDWYEIKGQRLKSRLKEEVIEFIEWEVRGRLEGIKMKKNSNDSFFWYDFSTMERLELFFQKYTSKIEKTDEDGGGEKEIKSEVTRGHGIKTGKPT